MIQESCPDINRTIVRIIAELASEYYKMLVPNRQESSKKQEIKIKKNAKEEILKKAPDEVLAKAIHDTLLKQHQKPL